MTWSSCFHGALCLDDGALVNMDLLQASLSFKFEIVRKMRKLKNKEKKKRKRGEDL